MNKLFIYYNNNVESYPYDSKIDSFLTTIEEALFIKYELTPSNYNWRQKAALYCTFKADYHDTEFVKVYVDWDMATIKIEDY